MSSRVMERSAETQLDLACMPLASCWEDHSFDTVLLPTTNPSPAQPDQSAEEIYALFEEAISDRVERMSRSLKHLPTRERLPERPIERKRTVPARRFSRLISGWSELQLRIVFCCFTLNCLLAGFDLMGLLVLHRG
jgi:hypothetical protein